MCISQSTSDSNAQPVQGAANVATAFGPSRVVDRMFPDMGVMSSDQVIFYVHRQHLSRVSTNGFAGLLSSLATSLFLEERASVLNIAFHIMYGMPCAHYSPPLVEIEAALDALVRYGVNPYFYASPLLPLYELLLLHAPYRPIEAYALAGKYSLEEPAVAISAHLLAYDLSTLSDDLAIKIGPVYLRRLMGLHRDRTNALKAIVLRPLENHTPTLMCGEASQAQLTQAWAYAAAELAWDTLPGLSTNTLQTTFEKAATQITCLECQALLHARIREVCQQWFAVKVRLSPVQPRRLMGNPQDSTLPSEDNLSGCTG
ncbi:hypothetical protein BD309DRAFT_871301 [Dichomitus squalens]|uniref:Uncharacterized protein n=1 Tax=Dichomitus squalens TaxID=114155 RepID=A0A4Q9MGJ6_9APHY|nr:hypothetical protein BD311DRAFT_670662 [Dichomitus squalens]TBU39918.1 hypothetical protein BD309DRAFT_871301 [Dichomitus squalens]